MEYVRSVNLGVSVSARIPRKKLVGNSNRTIYEERRSENVPGSSVDGGYDVLDGCTLLSGLVIFPV